MSGIISLTMWSDFMRIVTREQEKIFIQRDGKEIKVSTEYGSENIKTGIIKKLESMGVDMRQWQKEVIVTYAYK